MAVSQGLAVEIAARRDATRGSVNPPVAAKSAEEVCRAGPRTFSAREVASHDSLDSLWVIIRNKVYDVTAWVPHHPGGDLIALRGGRDCTVLFDSYHPLSARAVLSKFYIGDTTEVDHHADSSSTRDELEEGSFYHTLKVRVHAYFKAKKVNPRDSSVLFLKAGLILITLALSYYGSFFAFETILPTMVSAIMLGIAMAEVGVSIQHDANHGAFSYPFGFGFGVTLDAVGASSFMWQQQHMVGHHVHTNVHEKDPDIRVSEADVRRVTRFQPCHWYQAYQHLYLGLLYGLLSVKSVLVDDFHSIYTGTIGSVKLRRMSHKDLGIFWGGKIFWAATYIAAPTMWSGHGWGFLLAVWTVSQAITGWILAFLFQVAHVVDEVQYLREGSEQSSRGWAANQVATTADFSHGSFFWTHLSGGLNYQVVHHLFPAISHTHYPAIAPIVMRTCQEFSVPYKVYPTFWSAISAHFRHLRNMGLRGSTLLTVPSLASVG